PAGPRHAEAARRRNSAGHRRPPPRTRRSTPTTAATPQDHAGQPRVSALTCAEVPLLACGFSLRSASRGDPEGVFYDPARAECASPHRIVVRLSAGPVRWRVFVLASARVSLPARLP